jgi:hypothetical protein
MNVTIEPEGFGFRVTTDIPTSRIQDLMCCGFEGGCSPWLQQIYYELAPGVSFDEFREGGSRQGEDYQHWSTLIPFVDGCRLTAEVEGKKVSIGVEDIRAGLKLFAERGGYHFKDFLSENEDAITGDVFLQFCFLKELVYG